MQIIPNDGTLDNFSKFIDQLQPKTKTLVRKFERILIKLYRQNVYNLIKQAHTHNPQI